MVIVLVPIGPFVPGVPLFRSAVIAFISTVFVSVVLVAVAVRLVVVCVPIIDVGETWSAHPAMTLVA